MEEIMRVKLRQVLFLMATTALLATSVHAESRKLGPDTAKSIQDAKVDPTFQTSKLDRVAVLPFANTPQYKEAASIITKNFVSQLSQMHPDYKFVPPDETINFVSKAGLDDQYNIFLGDYSSSKIARQDFLTILRDKLQIDAVFVGQIDAWGEVTEIATFLGRPVKKKLHVAGMQMALYRTTDGRQIWSGKDLISVSKETQLQDAAQALSEIFARFFGRPKY
jgi:hypothetical protein